MKPEYTIRSSLAAILLLALPLNAFAYLDPGTGSAIIQGIIAAASAALVTGHLYWARLKHWFRSLGHRKISDLHDDGLLPGDEQAKQEPKDQ